MLFFDTLFACYREGKHAADKPIGTQDDGPIRLSTYEAGRHRRVFRKEEVKRGTEEVAQEEL